MKLLCRGAAICLSAWGSVVTWVPLLTIILGVGLCFPPVGEIYKVPLHWRGSRGMGGRGVLEETVVWSTFSSEHIAMGTTYIV